MQQEDQEFVAAWAIQQDPVSKHTQIFFKLIKSPLTFGSEETKMQLFQLSGFIL
jgi:hypothetical protein